MAPARGWQREGNEEGHGESKIILDVALNEELRGGTLVLHEALFDAQAAYLPQFEAVS